MHSGGCHCGAIRFQFEAPEVVTVYRCNCSICSMTDHLHLIIPTEAFHLTHGEPLTYTFNSGVARHTFCGNCGIKSFYVPRSNPDGVSINYRCVSPETFVRVDVDLFDGQNWEDNAAALSALSQPK